ncbi:MAG: hypothetical protein FD123_3086 [Bacteroidetes bacterium]|nr:MAG: hypothetical protein FD123_3086 [Bacteroidota bacterium]
MRRASDHLYELIKSLDKQEKRYFKIFASRHVIGGQNDYIKLFDALDRMKQYDETRFRKKLQKEKFITRLPALKNYLYGIILDSSRAYHDDQTVHAKINGLIRDVEFLYTKTLYAQCRKLIAKAKVLCYTHEKYTKLIELFGYEKNIHANERFANITESRLDDILAEEQAIIAKLNNTLEYYNKNAKVVLNLQQGGLSRSDGAGGFLSKMSCDKFFSDESAALTVESKLFFYTGNMAVHHNFGEMDASYEFAKKYVLLIESEPERTRENIGKYITGLGNQIIIGHKLKHRQKEIEEAIRKLHVLTTLPQYQRKDIQLKLFSVLCRSKSLLSIYTGNFEQAAELASEIKNGINTFKDSVGRNEKVMFSHYLSYIYFGKEDFSNSLKWLNKILNQYQSNVREDIQCYSRVFNLIVHYEKDNTQLLEYELKSTYRFLSKRNKLFGFETVVLEFIKKLLLKPPRPGELKKRFITLKQELEAVLRQPGEQNVLDFFDFLAWLESKIESRPFAEIISRKAYQ